LSCTSTIRQFFCALVVLGAALTQSSCADRSAPELESAASVVTKENGDEALAAAASGELGEAAITATAATIDPGLVAAAATKRAEGESSVYGLLYLSGRMRAETGLQLERLGVELLGPHGESFKVRLPSNSAQLEAVAEIPTVRRLGLATPLEKLEAELFLLLENRGTDREASYELFVNLFEHDTNGAFALALENAGATLSHFDEDLVAYRARASGAAILEITTFDFVLFVELMPMGSATVVGSLEYVLPTTGWSLPRGGGAPPAPAVVVESRNAIVKVRLV
jgi:hypothetical protein